MNFVDRELQRQRIAQALPWIPDGARVLDVGTFDGSLFQALGPRLGYGVGLEPMIDARVEGVNFRIEPGSFPATVPDDGPFDVITMLAVLEHVEVDEIGAWADACRALLVPRGLVIATVPQPAVDRILKVLLKFKLADGMEVGQHHGMPPEGVVAAFSRANFDVVTARRFQLGLNNLFVFSPR